MKHLSTFSGISCGVRQANILVWGRFASVFALRVLLVTMVFFFFAGTVWAQTDYISENFDQVAVGELPAGWSVEESAGSTYFSVDLSDGVNNTRRLTRRMANIGQKSSFITPELSLGEGAILSFMYRVVLTSAYPTKATPSNYFSIVVQVSTDGGLNYQNLETIGNGNHTASNQYVRKTIDMSAFTGETVSIRMFVSRLAGDFYVDFDDVMIGNFNTVNFSIVNSLSEPLNGVNIDIDGVTILQTDAQGEASTFMLPGSYSYSIIATNYVTYSGSFDVLSENVVLPQQELIGNFPMNFKIKDQDGVNLALATVSYEGTVADYSLGSSTINGTKLSNLSGDATLNLREGSYAYTISKTDYYPHQGSFQMGTVGQQIQNTLQQYPLVSFSIEDANGVRLENVSITIDGFGEILTDVNGLASKRLPIGEYSFAASKSGYYDNGATFSVIANDDLVLPVLVLTEAPPTLEFITDVASGLQFHKTPVGFESPVIVLSITNRGNGPLTIQPQDISITGIDATDFGFTPLTEALVLNTDEVGILELVFSPAGAGSKTATLQISDDTGALHNIDLSGESYLPEQLPFYDDFSQGGLGNWVVVNDTQKNQWHAGVPAGDTGNIAAMVSNDGGITNAYQTESASSIVHFYMDFLIPDLEENLYLVFDSKGMGDKNIDQLEVNLTTPDTIPLAGELLPISQIVFYNQNAWRTFSDTIPERFKGQLLRVTFTWRNNVTGGVQPPFAVDNIYLGGLYDLMVAASPLGGGTVTGGGTYGATLTADINAEPANGYLFSHWTADAGNIADASLAATTFIMPAQDAVATAHFLPATPIVQDENHIYDGTQYTLTGEVPAGFTVAWYDAAEGGNSIPAPAASDAGIYTGWAAAVDGGGLESERVLATLTIDPRAIGVKADAVSKTYGDADPAFTYTLTQGNLVEGDAFTGTLSRMPGEEVGSYAIMQGSLALDANYTLSFTDGSLEITPLQLIVNATPQTKVYDEADPAFTYELTDGSLQFDDAITGSLTREAGEDVGTYAILQGSLDISANYILIYVGVDLVITPREIAIAADNQTKGYGEPDPELTWQLTQGNIVAGDAATGALVRETGEAVGAYAIQVGTLSFGNNYTLSFTEGELTITPKTLTIGGTFAVADKVFDGTSDAVITDNQLVLNGRVNDDDVTLTGLVAVFAQAEPGTDIPVELTQAQLTGAAAVNYVLDDQNWPTTTGTISAVTYTLSLEVSPADGGVVTGAGSYEEGATVSLTASPAEDYIFVRWEDDQGTELSTDTAYSYTMPAQDVTLTAVFQSDVSVGPDLTPDIQMFPNPTHDAVAIRSTGTITRLTILDVGGRTVFDQPVNQQQVRVATSDFRPGIYLVKIYSAHGVQIKKLQIQ